MKKIKVKIEFFGPVAEHNLLCWHCFEKSAIYDINKSIFKPCWHCQKIFGMLNHKKWYQFWK